MQEYVNNPQTQISYQPPKKKKTGKIILVILAVLIYTAVVATSTVFIDRAIIENETQTTEREKGKDDSEDKGSNSNTSADNTSGNSNSDNSPDDDSASGSYTNGNIRLNEKVTIGSMYEMTLIESEWCEEIYPSSEDAYSYYPDKDGEKYFVVRAKVKNISSKEVDFEYDSNCVVKADGKYEVSGTSETENSDGTSFYGNIKPLQEGNVIFYFSVSDEMYSTCSNFEVTFNVVNNEIAAEEYSYNWEESDCNTYKITFTK